MTTTELMKISLPSQILEPKFQPILQNTLINTDSISKDFFLKKVNCKKEILKDWGLPLLQLMFAKAKLFQLQLNCHKEINLSKTDSMWLRFSNEGRKALFQENFISVLVKCESNKATNRQHRRLDIIKGRWYSVF